MTNPATARRTSRWQQPAVMTLAFALLIGTSLLSWWTASSRRSVRAALAASSLANEPDLSQRLERARDTSTAERELARALVFEAMARGADASHLDDLTLATQLAARALGARPSSAEAAMLVGLARQLSLAAAKDSAIYTQRDTWERPLRAAAALAPGDTEPRRALAAALLEVWFALSQEERGETREFLRRAFVDPPTFERLIERWVNAASRPDEVFSILPEHPAAWQRIETIYARSQNWLAWRNAHTRHVEALRRDLERRCEDATAQLARGDGRAARRLFLQVLADAPPSGDFADLATKAVSLSPAGASDPHLAPALRGWLEWGTERYLYGQPGLSAPALDRLAAASGDLPSDLNALAALAMGQGARAELLETRAQAQWSESWGVYLMAKARALAAAGDGVGASRAAGQVHRAWRSTPSYWQTRLAVARATDNAAAQVEAQAHLGALSHDAWPATAWRYRGSRADLEVFLAAARTRGRLLLDVVPARGAVVEARWDGTVVDTFVIGARTSAIDLTLDASPGLHVLEVRTLAGEKVVPGELRTPSVAHASPESDTKPTAP